ncbi:MAG: hypothetical protein ACXQTL_02220 [Methanosarcinales archaeon]
MKIEGDTVIFKSEPQYFYKEESGLKRNTVKILNTAEHKTLLMAQPSRIRIVNTCEPQEYFEHELTDLSNISTLFEVCEDRFVFVFSWRHEE